MYICNYVIYWRRKGGRNTADSENIILDRFNTDILMQ